MDDFKKDFVQKKLNLRDVPELENEEVLASFYNKIYDN